MDSCVVHSVKWCHDKLLNIYKRTHIIAMNHRHGGGGIEDTDTVASDVECIICNLILLCIDCQKIIIYSMEVLYFLKLTSLSTFCSKVINLFINSLQLI